MADAIGNKAAKDYHLDVPAPEQGFFAKGLGQRGRVLCVVQDNDGNDTDFLNLF